jgi:hypothetical protein
MVNDLVMLIALDGLDDFCVVLEAGTVLDRQSARKGAR